jgi:ParB family chromosome partitioning protein
MTIAETEIFMVPLNKLTISEKNVRKTNAEAIDDLLASIPVHGLIQNLSVEPTEKEGHFAVVAGGRRLRALKRLAKEKTIAKDYPVPCRVVESEAEALSLAENYIRVPPHAADQFDAFKEQVDAGKTVEETADAFGVSPTVVKKRLKLAAVAPEIMKAFRKDEIGLNEVAAYTLTDNQERQRAVFKAMPKAASWQIKKALTEGNIPLSDKRVRIVTLEAYEAAGGGVIRDLFAERGDEAYLTDAALLDRLFAEKIEAVLEPVRAEGWQEVLFSPEGYYSISEKYRGRIYPTRHELTPEEEQQRDAMAEQLEALGVEVEADPDNEELAAQWQELSDRIDAMTPEVYDPEEMAKAVAVACFDYNGNLTIHRGLTVKNGNTRSEAKTGPKVDAEGIELPGATMQEELAAVRTACVAADLAANPKIALVATVHALAAEAFSRYGGHSACQISLDRGHPEQRIANKEIRPLVAIETALAVKREAAPKNPGDWWGYFLAMDETALLEHLAVFTAISLKAFNPYGGAAVRVQADALAEALDSRPERWVTLSDLEFLRRTKKSVILAAVERVKGKDRATNLSGMKKGDLVERATAELDGLWLPASLSAFASEADREKASAPYYDPVFDEAIEGDELDEEELDAADTLPEAAE